MDFIVTAIKLTSDKKIPSKGWNLAMKIEIFICPKKRSREGVSFGMIPNTIINRLLDKQNRTMRAEGKIITFVNKEVLIHFFSLKKFVKLILLLLFLK